MTVTKIASQFFGVIMMSLLPLSLSVAAPLSTERQATLEHLLIQDCGSCHGLRMTGGLGPALTPQLLADKSRESLIATAVARAQLCLHGMLCSMSKKRPG